MAFWIIVVYRINEFFVRAENLDRATYVYVCRIASKILVTQKAMSATYEGVMVCPPARPRPLRYVVPM